MTLTFILLNNNNKKDLLIKGIKNDRSLNPMKIHNHYQKRSNIIPKKLSIIILSPQFKTNINKELKKWRSIPQQLKKLWENRDGNLNKDFIDRWVHKSRCIFNNMKNNESLKDISNMFPQNKWYLLVIYLHNILA